MEAKNALICSGIMMTLLTWKGECWWWLCWHGRVNADDDFIDMEGW